MLRKAGARAWGACLSGHGYPNYRLLAKDGVRGGERRNEVVKL